MNVSKRRRISLSLFGQDNGVLIKSHLVTWKTKRKQKKRNLKKKKKILNNTLILHTKEKLQKLCKTKKKVAKLQFTKVIANYNLNYLYAYT